MKGRKPGKSKIRIAFLTAAAMLGLGTGTGVLDNLPKDHNVDTQTITTYHNPNGTAHGYNISPSDQLWKHTLGMKDHMGQARDLALAVDDGDSWRVRSIFAAGFNPYDVRASEALARAAALGHGDVVRDLLAAKVDINANDGAALISALRSGKNVVAMQLLAAGARADARDSEALMLSSLRGDYFMTDALLRAGADAKAQNSDALVFATISRSYMTVDALLAAGADPTAHNSQALRQAAGTGNETLVYRLLQAGADPAAYNSEALQLAASQGHSGIVAALLGQQRSIALPYFNSGLYDDLPGFNDTPLFGGPLTFPYNTFSLSPEPAPFWRAPLLPPEPVNSVMVRSVQVDANNGMALRLAAHNGHLQVVRQLLDAGAQVNALDGAALYSAVSQGNLSIAAELLDRGADANAAKGRALETAVQNNDAAMAQLLIQKGADATLHGDALTQQATAHGNAELVGVLQGQVFPHLKPSGPAPAGPFTGPGL